MHQQLFSLNELLNNPNLFFIKGIILLAILIPLTLVFLTPFVLVFRVVKGIVDMFMGKKSGKTGEGNKHNTTNSSDKTIPILQFGEKDDKQHGGGAW